MSVSGEVLETARRAQGMTQEDLAAAAEITQAALSRYEHGLRSPDGVVLSRLAQALGVTPALLERGELMRGGVAVGAHMRRRATAKVSTWRTLEARLNMLRLHASALSEEVAMRAELEVPSFDPTIDDPGDVARMLRAQWRMPVGPVHSVATWMEAAGVLIVEEDFGPGARVDGLSQWSSACAVVLLNSAVPADRKRLTLAHELGHLVLHSLYTDGDVEAEANAFASEFLMPADEIRPMLRGRLSLATLLDLKRYWGVSMAALIERAFHLGLLTAAGRTSLYKQMSARRWRTVEPGGDEVPVEVPRLARHVADTLVRKGLTPQEIATITGFSSSETNDVFVPTLEGGTRHLSSV